MQVVGGGQSEEALKRLMGDVGASSGRKALVKASLREDYETVFDGRGRVGEWELSVLERMRDEDALSDPVGHPSSPH